MSKTRKNDTNGILDRFGVIDDRFGVIDDRFGVIDGEEKGI